MSGSALAQRRSAHLPKLKDFPTDTVFESANEAQGRLLTSDLDFEYTDCDTHASELAELYTYSEVNEFALNIQCYRDYADSKQVIYLLCLQLTTCSLTLVIIYTETPTFFCRVNYLLQTLCGVLAAEIKDPFEGPNAMEPSVSMSSSLSNSRSASNVDLSESGKRSRRGATLSDNEMLRVVLSTLYHMTESIRREDLSLEISDFATRERFLGEPLDFLGSPLVMVLFDMMPVFCHGNSPHLPMRKVLLLIWKVLLTMLGGWKELRELKAAKRKAAGLCETEDTVLIGDCLKACNVNGNELEQNPGIFFLIIFRCCNIVLQKDRTAPKEPHTHLHVCLVGSSLASPPMTKSSSGDQTPIAGSPPPVIHESDFRKIPFRSKVREEDIEVFLDHMRMKFFHYHLPGDSTTTFGLPEATRISVEAMRRNVYVSLGDLQIQREKKLNRYLFSQRENDIELTNAEQLYRLMLPNLSQYVIALLKVLIVHLFCLFQPKNEAINILSDVLTIETEGSEVLSNSMNFDGSLNNVLEQSVRIVIDVNRHKEVMVKAASSILILLIKHFRLNHIYQFEYLCQHLVFANCIPLILKFLDQNIVRYIQSKHELLPLNYPAAPLYFVNALEEWPQLSDENVETGDSQSQNYFLWRNVFSMINLLRVLNKLTKYKHARTMMLIVFKSAPILKRALRIRLLYVLKLLKMQARYLGRQWRRSNMELMSSIFSRVRHRINDDWAFANESRSKSWDFETKEAALKAAVERFNSRRYANLYPALALEPEKAPSPGEKYLDTIDLREFEPVDNSFQSVLGAHREMSERFKRNYKRWLDEEVFRRQVNWDHLLYNNRGIVDLF
ncbi:unnamed protein product [Enterobius vermicularis]|uniref:DUF3402 domain-containing protein n=1 Tax=Enterobius vermicularis TaxID=51028 RepID=A0A0N4UZ28_ENTVE|nr:unnamed protein product [Enterobius vermicularis]